MPVIIVGQVAVPNVVGLTLDAARQALAAVYLLDNASVSRDYANTNGLIKSQSPAATTVVDSGTLVDIVLVSRGSIFTRTLREYDLTRPLAPTGLAGVGNSENLLTVSWNAATDPQGAFAEANSGVVGYRVYQDGVFKVGLPNRSVQLAGLTAYTFYAIQVSSVDAAGNESYLSAPVNVRTLDTTVPTLPTVVASQVDTSHLSIALTVSSSDSGSGL